MADQSIGTLPLIETLADDASFVAEQQGASGRVTGLQIKGFAKEGVNQYVTAAQEAAQKALEASEKALDAVASVEGAADEAAAAEAAAYAAAVAANAAAAAQTAAEAARDQAQAIAGGDFLPLAGGTLTGPLVLPGAPTADNQAATKKYVDDAVKDVGTGDMTATTYDPDGEVAAAGGIPAYVKQNGGKDEIFLTTITKNADGTYTADHTYAEIYAASQARMICLCNLVYYNNEHSLLNGANTYYVVFTTAMDSIVRTIKITSENEITVTSTSYLPLNEDGEVPTESLATSTNALTLSISSISSGKASLVSSSGSAVTRAGYTKIHFTATFLISAECSYVYLTMAGISLPKMLYPSNVLYRYNSLTADGTGTYGTDNGVAWISAGSSETSIEVFPATGSNFLADRRYSIIIDFLCVSS